MIFTFAFFSKGAVDLFLPPPVTSNHLLKNPSTIPSIDIICEGPLIKKIIFVLNNTLVFCLEILVTHKDLNVDNLPKYIRQQWTFAEHYFIYVKNLNIFFNCFPPPIYPTLPPSFSQANWIWLICGVVVQVVQFLFALKFFCLEFNM